MLLTVESFCTRARRDMTGLVRDLQDRTGRYGDAEADAWRRSLDLTAQVLRRTQLGDLHIQFGVPPAVSLEYRLPASSSWVDAVLLGRSASAPRAVMMELKDWDTSGDSAGPRPGLVVHNGQLTLHPGEQLRGYVEYCRRFHSAVLDSEAVVDGCVFMTRSRQLDAYRAAPHDQLAAEYPLFSSLEADLVERLPRYLESLLTAPDPAFATAFENGLYRQDRNFVRQVAHALDDPQHEQFVLLDHQRLGFERCLAAIERALATATGKAVIVIEGPPGSGKSILAINLWAHLARDPRIAGSTVFATTSASQRSNWQAIFARLAQGPAGEGIVVPANQYNPGLTPIWVNAMRARHHTVSVASWKANLALFQEQVGTTRMPDNQLNVSIVDEAHALIDPTAPGKEGVAPSGWAMHAGPQAWHIMRASRVSVFLMDTQQSYRDNESTTRASLERWAADHDVAVVETVSLADSQFRCAGSKEYLDWLDSLLGIRTPMRVRSDWRRRGDRGLFTFEIVDDPAALDEALSSQLAQGHTIRLVASYGRKWATKGIIDPHSLAVAEKDFDVPYLRDGIEHRWSKIWNYAPAQDYTLWVQAPEGSVMYEDPLAEVGCPYVVRGFDYDFLGVLWLRDLLWRDGKWTADASQVHESAWRKTLAAAKRKGASPDAHAHLVEQLVRGYRILLSRAIRGIYLWCEDPETRKRIEFMLNEVRSGPA